MSQPASAAEPPVRPDFGALTTPLVQPEQNMEEFRCRIRACARRRQQLIHDEQVFDDHRHDHFLGKVKQEAQLRRYEAGPPVDDWVWDSFSTILPSSGPTRSPRKLVSLEGWCPPELQSAARPLVREPIPLPSKDEPLLTLDEMFVVVAAIHDHAVIGAEPINPFRDPKTHDDAVANAWYETAVENVPVLYDGYEAALDFILYRVRDALPVATTPPTIQDQEDMWITVTDAMKFSDAGTGSISRAATKGKIRTNGMKKRDRRLWQPDVLKWERARTRPARG